MPISEALEWKMSSTKEGLFNFLLTSLFHPCAKRGQWFSTCPEFFQPNETVRNWGLPGTKLSREEESQQSTDRQGQSSSSGTKSLWVCMSCSPKAGVWQMTTDKLNVISKWPLWVWMCFFLHLLTAKDAAHQHPKAEIRTVTEFNKSICGSKLFQNNKTERSSLFGLSYPGTTF